MCRGSVLGGRGASYVICSETFARGLDLRHCGSMEVDAENVGEAHEVEEDVRHLFSDPRLKWVFLGKVPCIGGGQPLEQFAELADFTNDGQEERLRVVELLPVALVGEGAHAMAKVLEI